MPSLLASFVQQGLFEPLDFLSRLAALVPSPGVNLTRYHGVFAPNHRLRAQIVPAWRGRGRGGGRADAPGGVPKHVPLGWEARLKRVFGIDIQRCEQCGGAAKIIASIEDPELIERILAHVDSDRLGQIPRAAAARGPPSATINLFESS